MRQQGAGVPRVLRRNQAATAQRFARTRAQIAQVADRRRHHVETPCIRFIHYNPRLYERFKELKGMAVITRRPRLALCTLSTLLLITAACSLVKPAETAVDKQARARTLASEGKHADAARIYAELASESPADRDNYD